MGSVADAQALLDRLPPRAGRLQFPLDVGGRTHSIRNCRPMRWTYRRSMSCHANRRTPPSPRKAWTNKPCSSAISSGARLRSDSTDMTTMNTPGISRIRPAVRNTKDRRAPLSTRTPPRIVCSTKRRVLLRTTIGAVAGMDMATPPRSARRLRSATPPLRQLSAAADPRRRLTHRARAAAALAVLGGLAAGCGSSSTPSDSTSSSGAPAVAPTTLTASPSVGSAAPSSAPSTVPSTAPSTSSAASSTAGSCSRSVHQTGRTRTIGLADDASTVCLTIGEQLRVVLPADAMGGWAQVGVVGPALSRPQAPAAVPSGQTVATTQATGPGTGRVLAVQDCPGQQGCRTWVVEVRVRAAP